MARRVSRTRDALALAGFVVLCFGIAGLGGRAAATGSTSWYPALRKPSWTPPEFVFGPVWTVLYALIATAGWLVWRERRSVVGPLLYLVQLALNLAWPWLFFGGRRPDLALVVVAALCLVLLATITAFWRVNALAALLFLPYLGWVVFATTLNAAIWTLN